MTADGFIAHLAAHPTASAALAAWCRGRLAGDTLVARVIFDVPCGAADVPLTGMLHHRRVALAWGTTCVSEAENWYRPASLPPDLAAALAGDRPFGTLIAPLHPQRRVTRMEPGQGDVFLHVEAILSLPGQGDIAFVRERYRRDLLGPG
ncbi:hypothetical protein [Falsirhodobacter halotolerans]|uniref:hypothetical protein n=1 Tax=Falsirhodobacter halotolerans TaxID=1146892 RepID=UPI001FD562CE|nr:hypothetical protein [Falsirhodobacter halotolerans]MCJ8140779.1 hypothetical protein [Falsirhodobacter halotolerans]